MISAHNTVYRYRYMPTFHTVSSPFTWPRAFHTSELPLLFNTLPSGVSFLDYEALASKYMQDAWVTFAKDPEDGLKKQKGWPKYSPEQKALVELFPGWVRDANVPIAQRGEGIVRFVETKVYDEACKNPPRIPWEQLLPVNR